MKRLTEHLLVVSFDALRGQDYDMIKELPNFKEFLSRASFSTQVQTIYPSLTYPAHTSIITGKEPRDHGIINNTLLQPNRKSPDWYWQRSYIKGETLYDIAIEEGLKVASLLWPVTAKSKIQYNVPEIFSNRPWTNQIMVSLLNGTPLYQYKLNKLFGHLRAGTNQPNLDNFTHQALCYTLKKYKTDLTMVHFTDLDSMRHLYGVDHPRAYEAIVRHDTRLGEIIQVLKETNRFEETTIVLLGDHSALDEDKILYINHALYKAGYIDYCEGKIRDYQAIFKHCDGSGYVYIHKQDDESMLNKVHQFLIGLMHTGDSGIEAVYTREEAKELGADPNCSFMLEAKRGYYFLDDIDKGYLRTIKPEEALLEKDVMVATHGYAKDKEDYKTIFMAAGKGVKSGIDIGPMSLIDEGPTMARILGLVLKEATGRILNEIIP